MSDSILSVYSDARTEYTKQLCAFLVPAYFQFFLALLEKARDQTQGEHKKLLWHYQTLLNDISEWNMEKVNTEVANLQTACGCDYMDDLLTAVFIAHTKVLTAIRVSSKHKKIQINVPKVEHFLFKALCETGKLLWGSTYLFREDVNSIEKQQNYRSIESLLQDGVVQAVRALVPVKSILRDFVSSEGDDDEDEKEVEKEKEDTKEIVKVEKEDIKEVEKVEKEDTKEVEKEKEDMNVIKVIKEDVAPNDQPIPIIRLDDKPEVTFAELDEVFDSENPDGSDLVIGGHESPPGLEIMDGDAMPLSDDLGVETLNLDEYEVLV